MTPRPHAVPSGPPRPPARVLRRIRRMAGALAAVLVAAFLTSAAPAQGRPLVPEAFRLSEAAQRAIDVEWLTDDERSELRVFHGVWDERDLARPKARAIVALNAWRLDDPVFADPGVPAELKAEAKLRAGDLRAAIDALIGTRSVQATRIKGAALEGLGEYDAAARAIDPVIQRLLAQRIETAGELTDGVRALVIRARLEGQPARDYQAMMQLLSRAHQELDRLHWPAKLAEAELLLDKWNTREAVGALHETLALNPRCAEAWYRLGLVALGTFDFDGAAIAAGALRRIDPAHPLADMLHARSRLTQEDPEEAIETLERVTARWPRMRPALALLAGATAMTYDDAATAAALDRFTALSPDAADAHFAAGKFLSMFRQYDAAAAMLEEAIRRQPSWGEPRIELGLMEMQTGRDEKALGVLRETVRLDPFNKRAANSLHLLEDLQTYAEVETEHFIIRYQPGIDEVLVDLMPEPLERIHALVAKRFGWETGQKTIIEVMPDHQRFAVRITGMPHIHTIAACTGPIIAMEVPRDGAPSKHLGTFNWERVLQHEYTHTITLDQTRFRIPHWLTEAAAVSMELAPRDYDTCAMLADSWRAGTLFDLDEIKWAFVRPKLPGDRGKAYAQGHWMVEFMNERFGPSALVALLARYFEGDREEEAMPKALGVSRDAFFSEFLVWAGAQVKQWGMDPQPPLEELVDELRWADPDTAIVMAASQKARLEAIVTRMAEEIGNPAAPGDQRFTADEWPEMVRPPVKIDDDTLMAWRREYPDHPDILAEELRRRIPDRDGVTPSLVPKLERLAELRPVDVYPHRKLAQVYLDSDDPGQAIPHLEALDIREEKTPVYARELASLYRARGELETALDKAQRAVSIAPYHAGHRELAAAIAVESRRLDVALRHVKALTLLEPDRPQHKKRMERIQELLAAR